ncbi:PAS domain S-box protein (plasmid) [Skermanella mucosa]|nr:PAS domain S-box protein [Skermanella mucosa]UEM24773.1 PAS domain S-box protein [Skermanella mucosa]
MKLPHRLLAVVALALLPISALQIFNALQREKQQTEQTYAEARRLLQLIEDEQRATVSGIHRLLATLRQTPAVAQGDAGTCQPLMDRLRAEYPSYLDIYVTDRQGTVTCASDRKVLGVDLSQRVHVRTALAGGGFFVGNHIVARKIERSALPFSLPYRAFDTGEVSGAVIALLDAAWLESHLAGKPLPPTAILTVADREGTIIAQAPHRSEAVGSKLSRESLALLNRSGPGVERVKGADGLVRLVAFSPVDDTLEGVFMSVGVDEEAALGDIRRGRDGALALLAVVAACTAAAVFWIGRRYIEDPAALLAGAADRWRSGDLSARASVPATAVEFAELADDFNAMADSLDARGRELRASEGQHRAVFETAVDAMVVIDEQGTIHGSNPAAATIFGYSEAEMLGRNVSMLMADDHRAGHDGYLKNYLRTGSRRIIGIGREVMGRRSDGTLFPLELSIAEWRGLDGGRYFTGIMRNISSRRAAEREVEEERSRLRRVIENAPFPAIVHADTGEVLHVSRAWLDITGYSREDLPTMEAWAERAYGGTRNGTLTEIDRLYSLDRPVDEGEYMIRTAEGKKRIWAFRSAPVGGEASGRRLVVSMAADITERRDSEERLKLLMREVDHRAKNALMVVQSIVQLSRSEDPVRFTEAVEGRIQAMSRAHSLLAAARWSGADLRHLLMEELTAYGGGDRLLLEGPPVSIRPEATQAVSLALHELTTNAVKHGALSDGAGRVRVSWTLPRPEEILCILWEESGGGADRRRTRPRGFRFRAAAPGGGVAAGRSPGNGLAPGGPVFPDLPARRYLAGGRGEGSLAAGQRGAGLQAGRPCRPPGAGGRGRSPHRDGDPAASGGSRLRGAGSRRTGRGRARPAAVGTAGRRRAGCQPVRRHGRSGGGHPGGHGRALPVLHRLPQRRHRRRAPSQGSGAGQAGQCQQPAGGGRRPDLGGRAGRLDRGVTRETSRSG